jgi:iron complex transport system substrate-binding protein
VSSCRPRRSARGRPVLRGPVFRGTAGVCALLAATCMAAACSSSATTSTTTSSAPPAKAVPAYPVTVTSCGVPVTYDRAPQRAVSNDINTTEDMLALGLESHMVGTFAAVGDGPVDQPAIPPQYQAGFKEVRDVNPDNYFTLEQLVALKPDFLFAGWNYGLQTGTNLTPTYLSKFGIKTLVLDESCAHVAGTNSVSINDTYTDLRNLGEIFNVRARASQLIASMQAQVAAAQAKIAGLAPIKVFDYDSGESAPVTGPGLAMPTALLALGGGVNIFASLKESWTTVSWEQVVAAQPQCIIINDYSTPTVAQKEKFLETYSASKNLPAVKNRCFLPLSYDEVTPGVRNAEAVVAIAKWLHPAAFGLPADGS